MTKPLLSIRDERLPGMGGPRSETFDVPDSVADHVYRMAALDQKLSPVERNEVIECLRALAIRVADCYGIKCDPDSRNALKALHDALCAGSAVIDSDL